MTEASKARKRHPMRIIHGPPMDPEERAKVLRALSEMRGTLVLPPGATFEVIYPRRPHRPIAAGTWERNRVRLPKGMTWAHVERVREAERLPSWFPSGVLFVRDVATVAGVGGRRHRKSRRRMRRA